MSIAAVSQDTIRVDVGFYDGKEREKLFRYPTASVMQELTKEPIEVPTAEFLSHFLFHRKRLGTPGYRDLRTIGYKLDVAMAILDGGVDFNGHSICTAEGVSHQLTRSQSM